MDQPNRINPMSFTVSGKRQTPKNEFGQVLAETVSGAVKMGAGIVGSLPGMPAVSAAVNAVSGVVSQASASPGAVSARSAATGVVNLGGGGGSIGTIGTTLTGSGGGVVSTGADKPVYTDPQVAEMARMSDYYLNLQNQMQQESREYNAVSNIIKVRHDSAKAAINNIR